MGEAGCAAGLGTQLAGGRRFAGSPAQGEGESGPESGKWSFLARMEREGRALGLPLYLVRNPCPFGLRGWAGTELGGSVASGTGWDRVGAETGMEGGRWDCLAERGCTCVSFIGGGVLRSTCLCESRYLTGTQAICSVSTWPLEAPWKEGKISQRSASWSSRVEGPP